MGVSSWSTGNAFGSIIPGDVMEMSNQQLMMAQALGRGMGQYISVPSCKKEPLFGEGLEGARRLVAYEETVLGVTNNDLKVTEVTVHIGTVLHNCWTCRLVGWLKRPRVTWWG